GASNERLSHETARKVLDPEGCATVTSESQVCAPPRYAAANHSARAAADVTKMTKKSARAEADAAALLRQREADLERVVHVDRFTARHRGMVAALLQRLEHGLAHEGNALEHAAVMHASVDTDDALDRHLTLGAAFDRFLRVLG